MKTKEIKTRKRILVAVYKEKRRENINGNKIVSKIIFGRLLKPILSNATLVKGLDLISDNGKITDVFKRVLC